MSTLKQKAAALKMVENGGNASRAMIDAGYSPATAKNPSKLTESEGFADIKERYYAKLAELNLGPEKMAEKIDEWLHAQKPFSSHTEPDKMIDDYQTQLKAGEMLREDLGIKQAKDGGVAIQINNVLEQKKDDYNI